jgi:hypothetical protein
VSRDDRLTEYRPVSIVQPIRVAITRIFRQAGRVRNIRSPQQPPDQRYQDTLYQG